MRATTKKARPGELRVFHGRLADDAYADVILAYGGHGASKRDSNLLHMHLCTQRPAALPGQPWEPSLIEELKARGYDIETIEFRIRKLPVAEAQQ